MTVFDRIKNLADKQGISVSKVATDLGFSENLFYQWKKASPKSDRLEKVADYFDVSVDYLLGRNETPDWASHEDIVQLEDLLNSNQPMQYGGIELNEEDKHRIDTVLSQVFWERLKKKKDSE
ncbi:helix-turn-helix domain-containing protein [Enterococcus sp. AZ103]|uniref:helix-turn-helix domain-containing protein n=1 Tax=Enterococcus sp. AZ103 TaxID=2774628 RepID=UPI003F213BA8